MNIAEILKDCPKGTKLYSSLYGEVELVKVKDNTIYPIVVSCLEFENYIIKFDKDGKNYSIHKEPTLFPSKDQRDWSKYQETKHQLKQSELVLVRDSYVDKWRCDNFCYKSDAGYYYVNSFWCQGIKYKGNKHLVGTTNKP